MNPVVMKGSDYLKEHKELIGLLGNTSKALRKEALAQTTELTQQLMKNPTRKNALALAKRGSSNLGKRMTTRGNRLVLRKGNVMGSGLFDVLSGKQTLDFDKLADKAGSDWRSFTKQGKGFDDVISHYRKVQDAKEAEKAKEYAERKSRIENADNDYRAMVAKYGLKGNVGNGIFGDLFEDAIVEGGKKLYQFDKSHGSHLKEGVKSGFKNMVSNIFKGGNGVESVLRYGRGKGGNSDRPPDGVSDHRRMILEGRGMRFAVLPDVMPEYDATDVSGWIEKERRSTGYYDRPAILGEGM